MTDTNIAKMILDAAARSQIDLRSTLDLTNYQFALLQAHAHPTSREELDGRSVPTSMSLTSDGATWLGTFGSLVHTLLTDLAADEEATRVIIDTDTGSNLIRHDGYFIEAPTKTALTMLDGVVVELGNVVAIHLP